MQVRWGGSDRWCRVGRRYAPDVQRQVESRCVGVDIGHPAGGQQDDVVAGVDEFTRLDVVVVPDVHAQESAELIRVAGWLALGLSG